MASGEIDVTPGLVLQSTELIDNAKLNQLAQVILRLKESSVTSRELAPGSIDADKLAGDIAAQLGVADGAVSTAKIVNAAVTLVKLADGIFTADAAGRAKFADGFLPGAKLATGAAIANMASGALVQSVRAVNSSSTFLAASLPLDNTIPQNSEGTQILTLSITPLFSDSVIRVSASIPGGAGGAVGLVAAVFRDADTGAFASAALQPISTGAMLTVLDFITTSKPAGVAIQLYLRAGRGATLGWTLNGDSTLGGTLKTYFQAEELKA